jgi:hypothetical protein
MTRRLTESQIGEIWNAMPGGDKGFLVEWGYMQFARSIERAIRGPEDQDGQGRKAVMAELEWAIANNEDRPRTEAALRWALEALEEMDEVKL